MNYYPVFKCPQALDLSATGIVNTGWGRAEWGRPWGLNETELNVSYRIPLSLVVGNEDAEVNGWGRTNGELKLGDLQRGGAVGTFSLSANLDQSITIVNTGWGRPMGLGWGYLNLVQEVFFT